MTQGTRSGSKRDYQKTSTLHVQQDGAVSDKTWGLPRSGHNINLSSIS